MSAPPTGARYRHLAPEDVAHLTPKELADYQRERGRFDAPMKERATYEVMRARVDAVIASEREAGADRPDATWAAPRCVMGHVIDEGAETCPTCEADRAGKAVSR